MLALALIADSDIPSAAAQNQEMLVTLLKNESFLPSALDFKSFTAVCIAKKNQLLLKTFL
jgi:hypothetical protein